MTPPDSSFAISINSSSGGWATLAADRYLDDTGQATRAESTSHSSTLTMTAVDVSTDSSSSTKNQSVISLEPVAVTISCNFCWVSSNVQPLNGLWRILSSPRSFFVGPQKLASRLWTRVKLLGTDSLRSCCWTWDRKLLMSCYTRSALHLLSCGKSLHTCIFMSVVQQTAKFTTWSVSNITFSIAMSVVSAEVLYKFNALGVDGIWRLSFMSIKILILRPRY